MKFADFVCVEAIRPELSATDKPGAIREMVAALVEAGVIGSEDQEPIIASILEREELGSTGIGRGVAIPHAKHAAVKKVVGTVGICPEGIDFRALDGGQVFVVFLMMSPPDAREDHLKAMKKVADHLRNDTVSRFLRQSRSVADVRQVLDDADSGAL